MCFPLLAAKGLEVGRSRVEEGLADVAGRLLAAAASSSCDFVLPTDIVVAAEPTATAPRQVVDAAAIPAAEMGLDIGPATAAAFAERLRAAGTVFWNGPMGLFEVAEFASGTRTVGEAVAACPGVSVVGGGDTVSAVRAFGLEDRITHVSTGGGASMEFLEGRKLPGVEALLDA
jgi:phosphoglycerate kinase